MSHKNLDKCPRCGAELESGLLSAKDVLRWHPVGEKRTLLNRMFGKRVSRLGEEVFHQRTEAQRCAKCGLVMFTGKRKLDNGL